MKREQFELTKIKVDKEGRVECFWRKQVTDGDAAYYDKCSLDSPRLCSPDLREILSNLREILAHTNQLYIHKKIETFEPSLRAKIEDKDGQRIMKKLDEAVLESMQVSGVSMGGDLETGWCVITGTHKAWNTAMAMNSPKISLSADTFMIENQLKSILVDLSDEAYAYAYEDKGAEKTLFKKAAAGSEEDREGLQEA